MYRLLVTKAEFMKAVKHLVFARFNTKVMGSHFRLWAWNENALFATDKREQSCFYLESNWEGEVVAPLNVIAAFKKVPPETDVVEIQFDGKRLAIGNLKVPATWDSIKVHVPTMNLTAGEKKIPDRVCSNCAARKGRAVGLYQPSNHTDLFQAAESEFFIRYRCEVCAHRWLEYA